jgi:tetratricopeptide (TPR) repeat protein
MVRTQAEHDAFEALQSEKDPHIKLAKAQAFLQQFPTSEIKDMVYVEMLIAHGQLGETAEAIAAGRQAVQANPESAVAFYNLGVVYTNSQPPDYNLAVWNLARAVALARAGQDSSAGNFEKLLKQVYVKAHGSEEGLPAIIAQAAASPTAPPGFSLPDPPLYAGTGVSPEDVVQGGLGSCYFHSTMAAIAETRPAKIQEMIHDNGNGTFAVSFADGKQETAYTEDLRYARQSGFDRSKALWVGVLLRAYAQRVLRDSLAKAVDSSDLFPIVKQYVKDFMTSNDQVLLAYDRAIRAVVDQTGGIEQAKLEANLKERLASLPIADAAKDSLVKTLESGGFFQTIAQAVQQDAEVFGAYRAVGQGGMPIRVMQTFLGGKTQAVPTSAAAQVPLVLSQSFQAGQPVVAPTRDLELATLQAQKPLPDHASDWFVSAHAYTVMAYDANAGTITLRNPWGHHPDPDGTFTLPLSAFLNAFELVETTAP